MELVFLQNGRLGNAIFRYFAAALLCSKYGYKYNNLSYQPFNYGQYYQITENDIKMILQNKDLKLPQKILLREFYQHDFIDHRKMIMEYIQKNKNTHTIASDDGKIINVRDIIDTPSHFNKIYDFVIHIRMGDFIENIFPYRVIISLKYYYELFDTIDFNNKKIAIVGETPKTPLEKAYTTQLLDYFKKKNLNVTYESNDLLTDFHIVKNAKEVVCCMSTFSWTAVFLSDKVEKCYFPDYPVIDENKWISMKKPCENIIYYKFY